MPTKVALAIEALVALAYARLILHRTRPDDILARNRNVQQQSNSGVAQRDAFSPRIASIIPRLASRLPWRADCLVQALAGQIMLSRRRIACEIVVGTATQPESGFEAHAWLTCAGCVILGGDIDRFAPLLHYRDNRT